MIPLIPVIALAAAISVGMILYVTGAALELQELRSDASQNTQERLQERLTGEYEGSPTNINDATIISEWTEDSVITGIIIRCPDGSSETIQINDERVPGGGAWQIDQTIQDDMQDAAGRCPP